MSSPVIEMSIPTTMRTRLANGLLLGIDQSVWLYRKVPLEPVSDAKSVAERMNAFTPLMAAYDELAALAHVNVNRRAMARSEYRQTHLLMVNMNRLYSPDSTHPLSGYLKQMFPNQVTEKRMLLLGVRLRAQIGGSGGLRAKIDSVAESLAYGGTPMSDYDADLKRVDAALARCGLSTPSSAEFTVANAWWNRGEFPDTVDLSHSDHIHVFSDAKAVRMADDAGRDKCDAWPQIPNHQTLTIASLEGFDFDFIPADQTAAQWATGLVADGAVAVSIRGGVEPANVTRAELRRQRKRYMDDINERVKQNKMEKAEQEEMVRTLEDVENVYATKSGSPTLTGASVLVAFDGQVDDITQVGHGSSAQLRVMNFRQKQALTEMMLCSQFRSNPNLHDMPSQTVAASGIQSLSTVGDKTGAILGFTERDRQPAYFSPTAAYTDDLPPIAVTVGQTGSGKSMVMLWEAVQFNELGNPQVMIDPKMESDHSATILAAGGQVASLDELAKSDGIFDPIRFSTKPEVGVELAVSMLSSIDPWGGNARKYEVAAYNALSFGVQQGAECIGQALEIALAHGRVPKAVVDPIFELSDASPLFRACVGRNPSTEGLRFFNGITLIKVGDVHLDLPEPGAIGQATLLQRVNLALVRMMVFGSAMALAGRRGVIHLDEAWVFLGAGKAEVERLGRVARSQQLQVSLYTQRISDALKADLTGYISRGVILPIEDPGEADAACKMFKLEPTPERIGRITAKAERGEGESTAPNWNSMRALRNKKGDVIRGSIGIYVDLAGRAVPVEIKLPPAFLRMASTNPEDIRRRLEAVRATL